MAGVENKAGQLFCLITKCVYFVTKISKTMLFQRSEGETYLENFLMLVVTPSHRISCFTIVVIIVPKKCRCNQAGCQSALFLPTGTTPDELLLPRRRDASQKDNLQVKLKEMRKALVKKAMQGDQKGRKATVISCPSFFLDFSDVQIKQVLNNCEAISSISDVMKCV